MTLSFKSESILTLFSRVCFPAEDVVNKLDVYPMRRSVKRSKKKALSQNGACSLAFDALRQCAGRALALDFAALQSDGVF